MVDHPLATSPVNANGVTTEVTAETCDGDALTGDPGGGGPAPAPVGQRGQCLTLSDHDRLRVFVQEFVVRSLIPWAERMVRALTEQVGDPNSTQTQTQLKLKPDPVGRTHGARAHRAGG